MMKNLDKGSKIFAEADAIYPRTLAQAGTLFFLLEGTVKITINQIQYEMSSDDVVIVNKGDYFEIEKVTNSNLLFKFIISDSIVHNTLNVTGLSFTCNSIIHKDNNYQSIKKDVLNILDILFYNNNKVNFLYLSHVYHLLNTIVQNFAKTQTENKDNRISQIEEYLKEHYSDNLSLKGISEQFYMDHAYLSRQFKKFTNVNFKEYLVELRLSHAEYELEYTERKVAEIALENGFYNVASFNKAFKKKFDTTPSQYREIHKKQVSKDAADPEADEKIKNRYFNYLENNKRNSDDKHISIEKKVNLKNSDVYFLSNWNSILNIGDSTNVLEDDCQQHISLLKHELDYTYGRIYIHFDIALDQINKVIDFLLTQKLTPWLVFDSNYKDYSQSLKTLLSNLSNRFGERLIKKWFFELSANTVSEKNIEELKVSFRQFRSLIKNISKDIMVGGYSGLLINNSFEALFNDVETDFYSFSIFNRTSILSKHESREVINKDSNYIIDALNELSINNKKNIPVYITEWGISNAAQNYLADSLYMGAYHIYNIISVYDKIAGMGSFLASDLFDKRIQGNEILSGKSGLLTKHGMYKPSMNAMKFLSELNNVEISYSDNQLLVGTIERDEIYIIFCNYTHPNDLYFIKPEQAINRTDLSLFFDEAEASLSLELNNIENGIYEVRRYRCSKSEGNILNQWRELDYNNNIRPSDLAYLKVKNMINMNLKEVEIKNKSFAINEHIENNDIFVINMRKQRIIN
jgi:xylan 1,4-beta-xylosidase